MAREDSPRNDHNLSSSLVVTEETTSEQLVRNVIKRQNNHPEAVGDGSAYLDEVYST